MTNGTLWTEERDAQLRDLREQGFSAAQIAAELGVTRSAVIGRAHRLGLKRQPHEHVRVRKEQTPKPRPERFTPFVAPPKLLPPVPAIDQKSDAPVTLLDLQPHHCRWPIGDSAPYMFCAGAKRDGSSYCERHFGISKRGVASQS